MLFAVIIVVFLTHIPFAHADDMSWVKKAEEFAKSYQGEAKSIVEQSEKASKSSKVCRSSQWIVQQSQEKMPNFKKHNRYPDLLIFVSFSMPMPTLKSLSKQAIDHGGKLVFRGLYQGSFKAMAAKVKEISAEVLIDPTLFKKHNIHQVPVFIKGMDSLTGNVSIPYALGRFSGGGL